jgi:hypothetical protein
VVVRRLLHEAHVDLASDVGGDQGSAAFLKESDGICGIGDEGVDRGDLLLEGIGDNGDTKRKRA